jgi:hypothetical protein
MPRPEYVSESPPQDTRRPPAPVGAGAPERGAQPARREEGANWAYVSDEQRQTGWPARNHAVSDRTECGPAAGGLLTIGSARAGCQGRAGGWRPGTDEPMIRSIMTKECPMCSEMMRMRLAERVDTIPGTQQTVKREYKEWTCPECDYFEDVDPEELLEAQ